MTFWKRPHGPDPVRIDSDEALCREVSNGNHEAFLLLFDRYWHDVFRLAFCVLRNQAEAEDLVQDLFLEVHTTMLRYDERRGPFRTLLLRYAYTRAIDQRRHLESRRYYATVGIEEVEEDLLAEDTSPVPGLTLEEGSRLIEQGMEHLDDRQRTVLTAYFFRGLSINEIAHELGESFGNTRHHLYRGLERMRKVVAPSDDTEENAEPDPGVIVRLHHRRLSKRVDPEVSVVRARSI
jgi:RNA polymerase sigma-70 factor, ECF subfamily